MARAELLSADIVMERKVSFYIFLIFIFSSCSELAKNTIPIEPTVNVHESFFSNPLKHGAEIRKHNFDLKLCQSCHGIKFDGGTAKESCLTCHSKENGPENCYTCHGNSVNNNTAPPSDLSNNETNNFRGVGAHQVHLKGTSNSKKVECNFCHVVPEKLNTLNHLGTDNVAEIIFNQTSKFYTANINYNFTDGSCSNSYCHGNFHNGNKQNLVKWTDGVSVAQCGTCHGDVTKQLMGEKSLPKTFAQGGFHPDDVRCSNCHDSVIDVNFNFTSPEKHINGINDFKK